jgi:hypothetical protein
MGPRRRPHFSRTLVEISGETLPDDRWIVGSLIRTITIAARRGELE